MRNTRAIAAGLGTAAMLAAAAVCVLLLGTAVVAYDDVFGDDRPVIALEGPPVATTGDAIRLPGARARRSRADGVTAPTTSAAIGAGAGGAPPRGSRRERDGRRRVRRDDPGAASPVVATESVPAAPGAGPGEPERPRGPTRALGEAAKGLGRDAGKAVGGPAGATVAATTDTAGEAIADAGDGDRPRARAAAAAGAAAPRRG